MKSLRCAAAIGVLGLLLVPATGRATPVKNDTKASLPSAAASTTDSLTPATERAAVSVVPTLSEVGLTVLGGLVAFFALATIRARRDGRGTAPPAS